MKLHHAKVLAFCLPVILLTTFLVPVSAWAHPHHDDEKSDPATPAYHKKFKDVEKWKKAFDDPERYQWQKPDEVIKNMKIQDKDVVADIGAGTGYFSFRIAKDYPSAKVYAADIEDEMIDYLASQAKERGLSNLKTAKIQPNDPTLPEKANIVLIVNTLHHIDDRVNYLKHLKNQMAASGRVALVDFTKASPKGPPVAHRINPSEAITQFKDAGFSLVEEFKFLPDQYFQIFQVDPDPKASAD